LVLLLIHLIELFSCILLNIFLFFSPPFFSGDRFDYDCDIKNDNYFDMPSIEYFNYQMNTLIISIPSNMDP